MPESASKPPRKPRTARPKAPPPEAAPAVEAESAPKPAKTPKPKPAEPRPPEPLAEPAAPPLTIWAVSDGRAGIEAQVLGIAEAVARQTSAKIEVKRIAWKGNLGRLPWWAHLFPRRDLAPESQIEPPWPDLWVAAGRATLPLSIRVKRWS